MLINLIKYNEGKYYLSITFIDENKERIFLENALDMFTHILSVNCMITDLDTDIPIYQEYFGRGKYYVLDHLTSVSIFAFNLNTAEIRDIISNWGYYTIDAIFALGKIKDEIISKKLDVYNIFKSMPIVFTQVLDNGIDVIVDKCYFDAIYRLLGENGAVFPTNYQLREN